MRGWAIAAVLLFLISTPAAFSQCDYSLQYSGEYRASIFDLWIDGNDLWAASGYGVQLYDRSVVPPRLTGSVEISGLTRIVRASNGVAYAAGTNGITIVSKTGTSLQLVRSIALAGINDLALGPTALFAATTSGIVELDRIDLLNLTQTAATFPTSNGNVSSLAINGSTLYAADGDSTVETFSIVVPSSPQKGASVSSLARAGTVDFIGSRLYVSDGQSTEVFDASTASLQSLGIYPLPSTSIAGAGSNVVIIAGSDREIRAIDATLPLQPIELFDADIAPTSGTVNRVTALRTADGTLYVGGGDSGITTYDISEFAPPFPLSAYAVGGTTSIVVLQDAMYVGLAGTGILELSRSGSGILTPARQWSADAETVQDGAPGFLLSSTGTSLKFWTLDSLSPSVIATATFRATVSTAFLAGTNAIVLLADGTLWTADMSQLNPVPVQVATTVGPLSQLAYAAPGTVATEVSSDGTTKIHYWSGDLNAAPVDFVVAGVSTALAMNGTTAATFTYLGITVIDLGASSSRLLAGSNTAVLQSMTIGNGKLIALTNQSSAQVWDLASAQLQEAIVIPGGAIAVAAAPDASVAGVATSAGVAQIDYGTSSTLPSFIASSGGNSYFRKAVASSTRLYLFDGGLVDIFELASTPSPHYITSVFAPGTIDFAASDTTLFTLSSSSVVTEFSTEGVQLRSNALGEGADVIPLAISAVAGAPWVSFSTGCTTGNCEYQTDVLDPQSLVRTASLSGGIIDVTSSGTRAYAIFDLPSELRIYDVSDGLSPNVVASSPTDVAAVSIAYSNGTIYLLADKVYAYSEPSLAPVSTQLSAQTPSASADLLIDGGCATIAGRSPVAETYLIPQWTAANGLPVPGTIRSLTLSGARLIILTDYSIEIWSRGTVPMPVRRRGVGRT